ncbi:Na(+)-translocating NADH-quinone reductase subunit A [Flavobacteriaceae bacterium]|jgi:Na+-transporting NADH:ubiquinone oxidoreductase subunit A|nr:Na(+)-translocating NADH-quinone reductase subunit A [Flavobacteriaceae bacterium]MDB2336845.1 Na(+)-translocating NADH-quinone reductase subunit A [Flavobacteriaceae bacterium]MDB2491276.1 Na(+)-translocating NADH-quinone reductase subunit A [Flavobacteriaceae bacterium]MDB2624956.1 Na(+)-translocating NADH-quinone reductase subunit A [Flavobacteriaceae bacterium]|tara:strand:+ start:7072 stop:8421 length:1350 start_codon:yes stop_codon:yes gene_type:complete
MSKDIRIKKGLDIKLVGEATLTTNKLPVKGMFALKPQDFHGIIPKLIAKEGAEVKAGESIFYSKSDDRILFPSPVSGKVTEIIRGAKRKIISIKIAADGKQSFKDFGKQDADKMSAEEVKNHLLSSGCWPFVKQRPFDIIANPSQSPKAIFISAYASSPLAANYDYTLAGKEQELQAALTAISKLTTGSVHVSVGKDSNSPFSDLKNIQLHSVSGPHPVGNVSTQISQIDPLNKGEVVWVINPHDLLVIGELLLTGNFNFSRTLALTGSQFENPSYVSVVAGASISDVVAKNINTDNTRIISGNVLSGTQVSKDDFLGYYDNQITAIPEGDDYEFFGWNKPVFNKISPSRALTFSWLTPKKKYDLNTNTNGEHRAFVVTGSYENVFPLDIFPLQFLKACMYQDLDEMENLGGYEVAPEDFALTEFICVSKQPHQKIVREGLDLMKEELG